MQNPLKFLAFDLGAESGRAVIGLLDGKTLKLEEVHRFANEPVRINDGLHWDVLRQFQELKHGLGKCVKAYGADIAGIGVDTWGVDFGLFDRQGSLLGNPFHYRDSRTKGMLDEAFKLVQRAEIYERTGIQFMQLNTLYQLLSMSLNSSPLLEMAEKMLLMPDIFNYWFTGQMTSELSIATTTQFYDPRKEEWSRVLLDKMGVPTDILPPVATPGTIVGPLLSSVAEEVGSRHIPVVAPACHDTGSAVAAVPATGRDHVYISCGTWSLMGVELDAPLINEEALKLNFTNEGGVCGTIRFLKNMAGLWLVQECRRQWSREGQDLGYAELTQMASAEPAFKYLIDPDDPIFISPGDMPGRIADFCKKTGQGTPPNSGAIVRCALDSAALKHRYVLECLEKLLGRRLDPIHMMGGGIQNQLLCRLTADVTGRMVYAGPIEATAIGNILMQAIATGEIGSLAEGREIVRNSFPLTTYEPQPHERLEEVWSRFRGVCNC